MDVTYLTGFEVKATGEPGLYVRSFVHDLVSARDGKDVGRIIDEIIDSPTDFHEVRLHLDYVLEALQTEGSARTGNFYRRVGAGVGTVVGGILGALLGVAAESDYLFATAGTAAAVGGLAGYIGTGNMDRRKARAMLEETLETMSQAGIEARRDVLPFLGTDPEGQLEYRGVGFELHTYNNALVGVRVVVPGDKQVTHSLTHASIGQEVKFGHSVLVVADELEQFNAGQPYVKLMGTRKTTIS